MREPFLEASLPTRTIFLPKYTSESLNWIEGFWGHTKDTFFSRMLTKKRESFYTEAVRSPTATEKAQHAPDSSPSRAPGSPERT